MGALLFHGDFYKAAVSYAGCHDNRMDKIWWNEQWMGWPLGPQYARASNVDNASKLQGDLLLVVGELDTNVDPASTLQVVSALIRADKQFAVGRAWRKSWHPCDRAPTCRTVSAGGTISSSNA